MDDEAAVYLAKAEESLAGAESEFAAGRSNNGANRTYSACFRAAVPALIQAGIRPAGTWEMWDHGFIQSRFSGQLVNRRKVYPVALRNALVDTFAARRRGDYRSEHVREREATRFLSQARELVSAVAAGGGPRS